MSHLLNCQLVIPIVYIIVNHFYTRRKCFVLLMFRNAILSLSLVLSLVLPQLVGGRGGYNFQSVRRWTSQKKLGYSLLECDKVCFSKFRFHYSVFLWEVSTCAFVLIHPCFLLIFLDFCAYPQRSPLVSGSY